MKTVRYVAAVGKPAIVMADFDNLVRGTTSWKGSLTARIRHKIERVRYRRWLPKGYHLSEAETQPIPAGKPIVLESLQTTSQDLPTLKPPFAHDSP
jgi:hypothetical protein